MVNNTGNSYRTRQAFTACFVLIAIAAAVLVYGLTDLGIAAVIGIFLLVIGIAFVAISFTYSAEADKFGPSEGMYRLIGGILTMVIGIVCILAACDVDWYVYVAVLIIGVAIAGMIGAVSGNKTSKY